MDENELRIAALELLLMELLARADASILDSLSHGISEGLTSPGEIGHGGDEDTIRRQALTIVDDARHRFELFRVGRPI